MIMKNDDLMQQEIDFILRNPETYTGLSSKRRKATLRLWHYPTFRSRVVWSLHLDSGSPPKGYSTQILRRIVWNGTPQPSTLHCSEARPKLKELEAIYAQLHQIVLPPFPPRDGRTGRDGSTYGVMVGDDLDYSELAWWQEAPAGWESLVAWHKRTTAYFESILPAWPEPQ